MRMPRKTTTVAVAAAVDLGRNWGRHRGEDRDVSARAPGRGRRFAFFARAIQCRFIWQCGRPGRCARQRRRCAVAPRCSSTAVDQRQHRAEHDRGDRDQEIRRRTRLGIGHHRSSTPVQRCCYASIFTLQPRVSRRVSGRRLDVQRDPGCALRDLPEGWAWHPVSGRANAGHRTIGQPGLPGKPLRRRNETFSCGNKIRAQGN